MTSHEKSVIQAALHWKAVFCFEISTKSSKGYYERQRDLEDKANDRLFEAIEKLEKAYKMESK